MSPSSISSLQTFAIDSIRGFVNESSTMLAPVAQGVRNNALQSKSSTQNEFYAALGLNSVRSGGFQDL